LRGIGSPEGLDGESRLHSRDQFRALATGVSAVGLSGIGVSAIGVSAIGVSAIGVSAIGVSRFKRVLFVVYTEQAKRIRLLSARKATPTEREAYESQMGS
jgi:hypothetical protein